jgi:hypothetical protein
MSKVFVSYRRNDTEGEAGHLLADLRRRFGEDRVFMDIAGIGPGEEFGLAIEQAISGCTAVLVLIGRGWLDVRDAGGQRRLDDERDWVRLEVKAALSGSRLVIPVLVQGATMPAEQSLPEPMRALARRNAHEISARRWDFDFDALAKTLGAPLGSAAEVKDHKVETTASPSRSMASTRVIALVIAGVALAVGLGWYFMRDGASPDRTTNVQPTPFATGSSMVGGTIRADPLKAPKSAFEKTADFNVFARLTSDLAAESDLSETQFRQLARNQAAACADLDLACQQAAQKMTNETFESVCRRKIGPKVAEKTDIERAMNANNESHFRQCVQASQNLFNTLLESGKDSIRKIKV